MNDAKSSINLPFSNVTRELSLSCPSAHTRAQRSNSPYFCCTGGVSIDRFERGVGFSSSTSLLSVMSTLARILLAFALLRAGAKASDAGLELFRSGTSNFSWSQGKHVCYRIPSLVKTSNAILAVVAERIQGASGFCSDDSEVNLVVRRSVDGGDTWSETALIRSLASPSSPWTVVDDRTGRIFVFYNTNADNCRCNVSFVTSSDDGASFAATSVDLPASSGAYGSALTHGITHRTTGRLVGCMRRICKNSCPAQYNAKSFFSDDRGSTWNASSWLADGTTECQVAELADGSLYMNFRPYRGWDGPKNKRLAAWSNDVGETWSRVVAVPDLDDWGFADEGSLASDPDADRVFFVHPHAHDRSNLTLWRSSGNATSWTVVDTVYAGEAAYSDALVLDRTVGVLFEADGYGRVLFTKVSV